MPAVLNLACYDDFTPRAPIIRRNALFQNFGPQEYQGHTYTGIGIDYEPELYAEVSRALGAPIEPVFAFFKLGLKEDKVPTWIHADTSVSARYAAILYLSDPPPGPMQGTAFWKHKELGIDRLPDLPTVELNAWIDIHGATLRGDSQDATKWDMLGLIGMKYNRLVVYPTNLIHSRFPENTWGEQKADGRLTYVMFFNIRGHRPEPEAKPVVAELSKPEVPEVKSEQPAPSAF